MNEARQILQKVCLSSHSAKNASYSLTNTFVRKVDEKVTNPSVKRTKYTNALIRRFIVVLSANDS